MVDYLVFLSDVDFEQRLSDQTVLEGPPYDLIVVLTGGSDRIREGLNLLIQGRGERMLISGIGEGITLNQILQVNGFGDLSESLREKIVLGLTSNTTKENAVEILDTIERYSVSSVLFLTSAYHMKRARYLFEKEMIHRDRVLKVSFLSVQTQYISRQGWYLDWGVWRVLMSEYFKWLVVRI